VPAGHAVHPPPDTCSFASHSVSSLRRPPTPDRTYGVPAATPAFPGRVGSPTEDGRVGTARASAQIATQTPARRRVATFRKRSDRVRDGSDEASWKLGTGASRRRTESAAQAIPSPRAHGPQPGPCRAARARGNESFLGTRVFLQKPCAISSVDCLPTSRETNLGANKVRCAVSKTNDDRSTSLTSPRARRYAMGGEARLGVYLSPSTNYERRILEDAFDGCAPRRFFTASDVRSQKNVLARNRC